MVSAKRLAQFRKSLTIKPKATKTQKNRADSKPEVRKFSRNDVKNKKIPKKAVVRLAIP